MDTSSISYRVADFLKKYAPFQTMRDEDLLSLAHKGRVRFFERNDFVLSQGASRFQILVIQQGTVLLWDERGPEARLLDVRGAGDILGIEQSGDIRGYPYSARSESDVLVYSFPADEFEALIQKYPEAEQFVSAYGSVSAGSGSLRKKEAPQEVLLHALVAGKELPACREHDSIREAAQCMLKTDAEAIVVLDSEQRARAVLTARSFLAWIVETTGSDQERLGTLITDAPAGIHAGASVADGVLAMDAADARALVLTPDGTLNSPVQAIVTSGDLGRTFGDHPGKILRDISRAEETHALRDLNQRARSITQRYLTDATASEWLAGFTTAVDTNILKRIVALAAPEDMEACWCFCGSSGRGETLTKLAPQVVLIAGDGQEESRPKAAYLRVMELLGECGYLPNSVHPFDPAFYVASQAEWKERYHGWISDPVFKEFYWARPLFDLRTVCGRESLWREVGATAMRTINSDFMQIVANDCLATLPPLTFYRDAVLDETGGETAVFRLEKSALDPLVDVGRVLGMAAGRVFGQSTFQRFATAITLVPEQAAIFHEASGTLRIVLWEQGRVGLSQGTAGSELPPALLGSYDRQVLKTCFRSILQLLEVTAAVGWLKSL